jgi:hypothetical protein
LVDIGGIVIKEFSVELTESDHIRIADFLGARQVFSATKPGRKTYAFDDKALTATAGDSFERFLWSSFDRVEEKGGSIVLANEGGATFFYPSKSCRIRQFAVQFLIT